MILAFRRPCADHRAALIDFADRRQVSAATPAALAHLDRCRRCEAELAETALAITALRRMHDELDHVEPPADAWLRLRARITTSDPWRWRMTSGGLMASMMLVAVLVLPITLGAPATVENGAEVPGNMAEFRVETAYLASIADGTLPPAPRVVPVAGSVPRVYPPEIAQVRKEVSVAPSTIRPSAPI